MLKNFRKLQVEVALDSAVKDLCDEVRANTKPGEAPVIPPDFGDRLAGIYHAFQGMKLPKRTENYIVKLLNQSEGIR